MMTTNRVKLSDAQRRVLRILGGTSFSRIIDMDGFYFLQDRTHLLGKRILAATVNALVRNEMIVNTGKLFGKYPIFLITDKGLEIARQRGEVT